MNEIQRSILILFSILIFFSSGSPHSQTETCVKFFFAATLLFFGLSPARWFRKERVEQEELIADENEEIEEDENLSSLPSIGFPTLEKMLILKSLVKLRSAEIANIYRTLRNYQEAAGDGNWVPLFMQEKVVSDLYYAYYVQVEREEEEQARDEAKVIFEERYKFCSSAPADLYNDQIADLSIALSYWSGGGPKRIIRRLYELKTFGFLDDWIVKLIREYQIVDDATCGGSFETIFKREKKTNSFKPSLDKISSLWSEIIRILKMSILLKRIQNNSENETLCDEDMDLREIKALLELERCLDVAITQENLKTKSFIRVPREEDETFFLDHLKHNPIWYHYS